MRRFIRYSALIGAVLGLGVGVMSNTGALHVEVPCFGSEIGMLARADRVVLAYYPVQDFPCWVLDWESPDTRSYPTVWFNIIFRPDRTSIVFPAALPCLGFVFLFGLTFVTRRRKPGYCRCGYSLEGLTSETCPECGRECEVVS
jgi:hypothetical protein